MEMSKESREDETEHILQFAETTTIDKSNILHHIITLLPKEFQDKHEELMNIDSQSFSEQISLHDTENTVSVQHNNINDNEEGITDPEELQRVNAGCILWDLSSVEEHAIFIHQHHIVPILHRIIQEYNFTEPGKKAHSERLLEISIGILANLCNQEFICDSIFSNEALVASLETLFLMTSDTRIIHELLRLYIVAASYYPNESKPNHSNYLLKYLIADSDQVLSHLLVILSNTMNHIILDKASQLMEQILYQVPEKLLQKMLQLNLLRIIANRMAECSSISSPLRSESLTETFVRICESVTSFNVVVSSKSFHSHMFQLIASLLDLLKQWRDSGELIGMVAVVVSNVISENADLSIKMTSSESDRLKTLLSILPVSDNVTATALWTILSHILVNLRKEFDCIDFNTSVHNTLQLIANNISGLLDQASIDMQPGFNENQEAIQFTLKLIANTLKEFKTSQKLDVKATEEKALDELCNSLLSNVNANENK